MTRPSPRRPLFLRIFVSLSAAFILITTAIVVTSIGSNSVPLTLPILTRALLGDEFEASAKTGIAIYKVGGAGMLGKYAEELQRSDGTMLWLIGPDGKEVLGRTLPESAERMAQRSLRSNIPVMELLRFRFLAAVHLENAGISYTVVFQRSELGRPRAQIWIKDVALRYIAGLLAAIAFSYFLSRLLARPVEDLRQSMRTYMGGTASVTVASRLLVRKDELGDLAREFSEMVNRIDGLLKRQNQLIADVSHELRSPLTRLAVAVELARDSTEREPELLERMAREVAYLEMLIQQLLRLAALENQKSVGAKDAVSVAEILNVVVGNAEFEAASMHKGILYERLVAETMVEGDEMLLLSALENVIRNAVRYTPANTNVSVDVTNSPDSPHVAVVIRDQGPGVPPEAVRDIFRPFYRIGTARDRESGGAGLGLSIAERSIALCGGTITAHNHPEGGLTVEVRLRKSLLSNFVPIAGQS